METQKTNFYQKISNVQASIGPIAKDSTNPFFKSKYFDINAIVNKLNPILKTEGLILMQPIINGSVFSIITDVDSSEKLESSLLLPEIGDAQKLGSCITYFRRYTLQSLLALEAEDDDGNKASQPASQGSKEGEPEKPWLNHLDKKTKLPTPQWTNVLSAIQDGKITSVTNVREYYKVNKEVAAKLEEVFNF